jgi:23S rRNA (adenine2503-C2)-methyltransferase
VKKDIKELTLHDLGVFLADRDEEKFRAEQIFSWIYKKGEIDFSRMSDLSFSLRGILAKEFFISGLRPAGKAKSCDGTEKFLFRLDDGNLIEAVSIPAGGRVTGCISTQAGCKFSCKFCASALDGFKRDLSCGEMLDEALLLKYRSSAKKLTHLVFMGSGEPLDNYNNLLKAIRTINSSYAFNIAARRITISTCGIIPAIKRLAQENLQVELSISLHACDDKTRSRIMPVNKKYPLEELISACRDYIRKTNRQVTFEYILIKEINSDLPSAKNLGKILKGLNCKVNLIPCNFIKELALQPPTPAEAGLFKRYLLQAGINATLRRPRGQDIEAACGQLRLKHENI